MGERGQGLGKHQRASSPLHSFGHGTNVHCLETAPSIGDLLHLRLGKLRSFPNLGVLPSNLPASAIPSSGRKAPVLVVPVKRQVSGP